MGPKSPRNSALVRHPLWKSNFPIFPDAAIPHRGTREGVCWVSGRSTLILYESASIEFGTSARSISCSKFMQQDSDDPFQREHLTLSSLMNNMNKRIERLRKRCLESQRKVSIERDAVISATDKKRHPASRAGLKV